MKISDKKIVCYSFRLQETLNCRIGYSIFCEIQENKWHFCINYKRSIPDIMHMYSEIGFPIYFPSRLNILLVSSLFFSFRKLLQQRFSISPCQRLTNPLLGAFPAPVGESSCSHSLHARIDFTLHSFYSQKEIDYAREM